MFIAIRDILFAKGRFALISSVIAMMTFMVVALSALTNGLANQSISGVTRLPGQTLIMQSAVAGQEPSLAQSSLDPATVSALTAHDPHAARLGVTTGRISAGDHASALSVFGADSALWPVPETGVAPSSGTIMLSRKTADDLGVRVGNTVTVGGTLLRVAGIGDTGMFAHTPIGYTTVDTWRGLSHGQSVGAVVLDRQAPELPSGTMSLPMSKATSAVPGFGSEHGSLQAMQGLLLAISALVVGSFFTVWTAQRLRQLAIVRAMGASRGYLLRDGLGQAALVLVIGEAVGAALGAGLAMAVSAVVPISLTFVGVALPVTAMAVLGAAGAALAIRKVAVVDPLVALAA